MDPNDELRGVLKAGPPKNGNQEQLWRSLYAARLHVAMAIREWSFFAMGNHDAEGFRMAAYTHRELATTEISKWRVKWITCGIRELCEHALALGSASVRINPGYYGYELHYEAMTAAVSDVGYGANGELILFDAVQCWVGKLGTNPPDDVLRRWRESAQRHGVKTARLGAVRLGKMPISSCISYAPPRNQRFEKDCYDALKAHFREVRLQFRNDGTYNESNSLPLSEDLL